VFTNGIAHVAAQNGSVHRKSTSLNWLKIATSPKMLTLTLL